MQNTAPAQAHHAGATHLLVSAARTACHVVPLPATLLLLPPPPPPAHPTAPAPCECVWPPLLPAPPPPGPPKAPATAAAAASAPAAVLGVAWPLRALPLRFTTLPPPAALVLLTSAPPPAAVPVAPWPAPPPLPSSLRACSSSLHHGDKVTDRYASAPVEYKRVPACFMRTPTSHPPLLKAGPTPSPWGTPTRSPPHRAGHVPRTYLRCSTRLSAGERKVAVSGPRGSIRYITTAHGRGGLAAASSRKSRRVDFAAFERKQAASYTEPEHMHGVQA